MDVHNLHSFQVFSIPFAESENSDSFDGFPSEGISSAARPLGSIVELRANSGAGDKPDVSCSSRSREVVRRRYRLLSANRRILSAVVKPGHNILGCQSRSIGPVITLHNRPSNAPGVVRTGVSGVVTCQSVWACPVCSSVISAGRAAEIRAAIAAHKQAGGDVYLLTLTMRHSRLDSLGLLLGGYKSAMQRMFASGSTKRYLRSHAVVGRITATEITHGGNGWHPHGHILLFGGRGWDMDIVRERMGQYWLSALNAVGLSGLSEFACDLQAGNDVRDYLTKFAAEISSISTIKQGRQGSRTPFEILADASEGDKASVVLWREYYIATRGRHSLAWSRGLKSLMGVSEVSDDSIVEDYEAGDPMLWVLAVDWRNMLSDDDRAFIRLSGRDQIVSLLLGRGVRYSYRPDDFSEEWDCVMNL